MVSSRTIASPVMTASSGTMASSRTIASPVMTDLTVSQQELCRKLRSELPSFDEMFIVLSENNFWWNSFVRKIKLPILLQTESLPEFARRVYTSSRPVELGILAIAYARASGTANHLFDMVDKTVLTDDRYLGTIDGLGCLVLLGKSFVDIGAPKKAWLLQRRGISMAVYLVCKPVIEMKLMQTGSFKQTQ
jgi:hypothetical protein